MGFEPFLICLGSPHTPWHHGWGSLLLNCCSTPSPSSYTIVSDEQQVIVGSAPIYFVQYIPSLVLWCIASQRRGGRWQICVFAISSLFPPRFLRQWSSQVSLLSPTNVTFRERSRICRKKPICFGQKSFRICPKTSCR